MIFAEEPRVFTFSMHCRENHFSTREKSDLDMELDAGCGDERYLDVLQGCLSPLFRQTKPDVVFFQAGVDPHAADRLGRLQLTREGLQRRNEAVLSACLSRDTPVVVTMGGGYPTDLDPSSEPFQEVVTAHADVYITAAQLHAQYNARKVT